jgi:hypothetical protein
LRSTFGTGVDTNEDEVLMQIVNPIAIEIQELWEGARLQYDFYNPASAEGVALDNIGAITSTSRIPGVKSTVIVQATGNAGATVPVGFQRAVQDTGEVFQNLVLRTLPVVGSQPLEFEMEAIDDGPIAAVAGALNQGALPSGITDIINAVDATEGTFNETDEQYRVSRKERLQALGAGTVVAIKAALREVPLVTDVQVLENDSDVVDANGQAAHSIRAIVKGGTDQNIIDSIGQTKAGGTDTVGSESGTFTDPVDGQTFPINFDRVSDINIYVAVVVTSKNSDYPATGDQDIEDAILALTWDVGEDVVLPKLQSAVTSIPGILAYTLFFDTSATPVVDVTISIATDELAIFDSTRITVSS